MHAPFVPLLTYSIMSLYGEQVGTSSEQLLLACTLFTTMGQCIKPFLINYMHLSFVIDLVNMLWVTLLLPHDHHHPQVQQQLLVYVGPDIKQQGQ